MAKSSITWTEPHNQNWDGARRRTKYDVLNMSPQDHINTIFTLLAQNAACNWNNMISTWSHTYYQENTGQINLDDISIKICSLNTKCVASNWQRGFSTFVKGTASWSRFNDKEGRKRQERLQALSVVVLGRVDLLARPKHWRCRWML